MLKLKWGKRNWRLWREWIDLDIMAGLNTFAGWTWMAVWLALREKEKEQRKRKKIRMETTEKKICRFTKKGNRNETEEEGRKKLVCGCFQQLTRYYHLFVCLLAFFFKWIFRKRKARRRRNEEWKRERGNMVPGTPAGIFKDARGAGKESIDLWGGCEESWRNLLGGRNPSGRRRRRRRRRRRGRGRRRIFKKMSRISKRIPNTL